MGVNLFSLPPEIRRQIYEYIFVGTTSVLDFDIPKSQQHTTATDTARRNSFTVSSHGKLGLLLASKRCYTDSISSYHEARTIQIRNLSEAGLAEFNTLSHLHSTARSLELDCFRVANLSLLPSFPHIKHLVLTGMKMWGGNMIVQRGQSALDAFNDGRVLTDLFEHVLYSSLDIQGQHRVSRVFPDAHIVIHFRVGNQVMDKNITRGVQDWDWACSYDVKADKLEKRLAHRLALW